MNIPSLKEEEDMYNVYVYHNDLYYFYKKNTLYTLYMYTVQNTWV